MKIIYRISAILLLTIVIVSCSKEYNCSDNIIQPAFIGFASSDIDTFVVRKFKLNDNYQTITDSFVVHEGGSSLYQKSNDTTRVFVQNANNDGNAGIKPGYDWQIFIPSQNKTVSISSITSEKKTGQHKNSIFSLDKVANCTNRIFSAKVDNQVTGFTDSLGYYLFIHN